MKTNKYWISLTLFAVVQTAIALPAQAGLFDDLKGLTEKVKNVLTSESTAPTPEGEDSLFGPTAAPTPAEKPKAATPAQPDVSTDAPPAKPVNKPKSYSLFYDQGDHLAELLKAGQFADAERVFIDHKAGFFDQVGTLDRKSRMDKYAAELRQLADALNATQKLPLLESAKKISVSVEKPHSEIIWLEWRTILQEARARIEQYRKHPLLSISVYQDASLLALVMEIERAEQRIRDRAIEVVLQNPPDLAASWLSSSYPISIDIDDLVNNRSGQIIEMLGNKSRQDVAAFHQVFGKRFDERMLRGVGDLLLDKQDIKGVGDTRLRQAMKAYQEVKAMGLKPSTIRGLNVVYAERADPRAANIKFGTRLQQDVPLSTKTMDFDSLSGKVDGNFLIVLDVSKAEVQRKEGWQKRVRSQYLAGHRNIPNPKYAEAKAAYEQARSAFENANSQDCSRDRGYGCAIAKTILVAAAGSSMAGAQKTVYSTPEFLSEPIYRNYDYQTHKVEVKRSLSGKAYFIDLGALIYQAIPIEIADSTSFPLVKDLSPEDTHYASVMAAHKSEQDIDHYADRAMDLKLSSLVDKYLSENTRAYTVAALDQLVEAIATGKPVVAMAEPPKPMQKQVVAVAEVDESVRKLQTELLAQRQQLKVQAQRDRLEAELARLKETASDKFIEDLQEKLAGTQSVPKQPNLHVLVIGINNYADVPDVPYAERSAQLFAELAKKVLGAKDENVILLTDAEATSGRLRGRLRTMLSRLDSNDRLVVYYAGHGVPAKDGKAAYLLAQDGGPGSFEEQDLQLDNIYASIDKSKVGQASLFIDACFSGRSGKDTIVFEGVGGITLVPKHGVRPDGRLAVITAGRSDQFSNQDKTHGHRLFGYHLMKALLEEGGNKSISLLHSKLRNGVVSDSRRIGPEFEQEPELLGNGKAVLR